mmetsp:Transcript_36876/g.88769  ORF Transcript_36876/g.88769 Transcript_36876/m.88769 type:complete len:115 (+) Transcript_36876:42-386(+)
MPRTARVIVKDLPRRASWQDLKDFCKEYTRAFPRKVDVRDGEGIIEFDSERDAEEAVEALDDRRIRPGRGSTADYDAKVRVVLEDDRRKRSSRRGSRSRSRSRDRRANSRDRRR